MSKERDELNKKKAEKKKSNLKSNIFKVGTIIVTIAGIIVGAQGKKS